MNIHPAQVHTGFQGTLRQGLDSTTVLCMDGLLRFLSTILVVTLISCASPPVEWNPPGPEDGLAFDTPSAVWDEALPLGNGILGALVWGDGDPLRISLDRSDLWDLRPVPEFYSEEYDFSLMRQWHLEGRVADLVRVYEDPYNRPAPTRIPAGRIEITLGTPGFEQARLELLDATARMLFEQESSVELLVHAVEPIGMVRFHSQNVPDLQLIPPAFGGEVLEAAAGGIGAGDLSQLGYSPPKQSSGPNWKAYLQEGSQGFRYAVHVEWVSSSGQWVAAWSVASSNEGPDPLETATSRVRSALRQGYDSMQESHRNWWRDFWSQSSVKLPNSILERQWFLEMYKFGSAARRGVPPISLQAVWTADDGKLPPWKGDYHHDLNTQLSYWPCYSGNHLEEGLGYLDWLWETRQEGFDWTERFFKAPGLNVPMTADLLGRQIGGWRQYTHSATTAAWLAQHFYLHWRFSLDRDFLEERAYPYLHDACVFLEAFTAARDADGLRTFPLSASPEINDNRPEAWFASPTNYDLALTRWLFGAAAELAAELQLNEEEQRWRGVLGELPELTWDSDSGLLIAPGYPLTSSHRHFSHLMAFHPLGLLDFEDGANAERTIAASLDHLEKTGSDWWTGYSFSWLGSLWARARNGEKAEKALEIFSTAFTLRNSFHCNGDQSGRGYSRYTYRPFTLEGNFAAAAAVQEMLLQSHRGVLRIFPAVPQSWKEVEFTKLRAQGAFLVSARRESGKVIRVEIFSEKGGPCRLISPFTGREEFYQTRAGETIFLE